MSSGDGYSRHLVYLVEAQVSSAVSQLRVMAPAEACGVTVETLTGKDAEAVPRGEFHFRSGSMLLVHRCVYRQYSRYRQLVQSAVRQGVPIVYDVDDLLLNVADEHPDRRYFEKSLASTLEATLHADLITVSSEPLKRALSHFHPHIEVIPNRLPPKAWELLGNARTRKSSSAPQGLRVGYVGTRSHYHDLSQIAPALRAVLDSHRDVTFVCYGFEPPPPLASLPNAVVIEPTKAACRDYLVYAAEAACLGLDIVLAPLADSEFNRCKSLIKMLEYGAMGVAAVYARMEPYAAGVSDGVTGLLAGSPAEWRNGLDRLIREPNLRRAIGEAAHRQVQDQGLLPAGADTWRSAWCRAAAIAKAAPRPFEVSPARDLITMMRQTMAYQQRTVEQHRWRQKMERLASRVRRLFQRKPRRAA